MLGDRPGVGFRPAARSRAFFLAAGRRRAVFFRLRVVRRAVFFLRAAAFFFAAIAVVLSILGSLLGCFVRLSPRGSGAEGAADAGAAGDDDVVDAEFEEVKEEGK